MKKIILIMSVVFSLNSYAHPFSPLKQTDSDAIEKAAIPNLEAILDNAESTASDSGRKILESTRLMISNQEIILGSCWDFVDAAYIRSGFGSNSRMTIFKSKLKGPYADITTFQGGDWLYFINHSYGDVEHSSIFVAWTNVEKKEALMISYAGGNRNTPARYKTYDLSSVYNIIRGR